MEAIDKNQTIDETKRKLKASREQLEGELEVQLQDIKRDAAGFGKKVLLIGGGLYVGYKLLKSITTSKEEKKRRKKKKKSNKKVNKGPSFGQMIAHQLVTLAVAAAADSVKEAFKGDKAAHDKRKYS